MLQSGGHEAQRGDQEQQQQQQQCEHATQADLWQLLFDILGTQENCLQIHPRVLHLGE